MSEPGKPEEVNRFPLDTWVKPLPDYSDIAYSHEKVDYVAKNINLSFEGVALGITLDWDKNEPHLEDHEPYLYFDGVSERLIPSISSIADQVERRDEIRGNLGFDTIKVSKFLTPCSFISSIRFRYSSVFVS